MERTLKQELQGKETNGKRHQGECDHHALFHHQAVLHILLIPHIPLSFPSPYSHPPSSPPPPPSSPPLQKVLKASTRSLFFCRVLKDRHWDVCIQARPPEEAPPPRLQNIDMFDSLQKLQKKSDNYHKTLNFIYVSPW